MEALEGCMRTMLRFGEFAAAIADGSPWERFGMHLKWVASDKISSTPSLESNKALTERIYAVSKSS